MDWHKDIYKIYSNINNISKQFDGSAATMLTLTAHCLIMHPETLFSNRDTAGPLPTIQMVSFILGRCSEFITHCCFWKGVVIFCGLLVSQQKSNGGIRRDNFCQICALENPRPTMRHTTGYWIGPASAKRLIPLGIYCRNCQAFSHKASSAVICHASLNTTSLLSCIT